MLTPTPSGGMGCDGVRAFSFAACDNELTDQEIVAIDEHLEGCASCRTHYTTDAVFRRAIRSAVALDAAPHSLRDRLAQILQPHAAENAST